MALSELQSDVGQREGQSDNPKSSSGIFRATSTSGGQKERRLSEYALLPVRALREIANVYGYGAGKYAPNNWRKGYPFSWSYSALQRHLNSFWGGENLDPESGFPHLAHAGFHILTLLTFTLFSQGEDDRYLECSSLNVVDADKT